MKSKLLLVGVAAVAIAGCSMLPGSASPSPQMSPLRMSSWTLSSIGDQAVDAGVAATLQFDLVRAGGNGGCNSFSTVYTTDGTSTLTFGPIAATRMFCEGPGSTVESAYFAALARVTRYLLQDDRLELTGDGDAAKLVFARAAPASVEGSWNVIGVNGGQGSVVSVAGVSANMTFMADGTLQGNGGCNSFNSTYTVDGEAIDVGPIMATRMACPDPAGSFEANFFLALDAATNWSVSGDKLELRDASGSLQVTAQRAG